MASTEPRGNGQRAAGTGGQRRALQQRQPFAAVVDALPALCAARGPAPQLGPRGARGSGARGSRDQVPEAVSHAGNSARARRAPGGTMASDTPEVNGRAHMMLA